MKLRFLLFCVLLGCTLVTRAQTEAPDAPTVTPVVGRGAEALSLWYRQPASKWQEALPLGNRRLGAMIFGDPTHEINEDTF